MPSQRLDRSNRALAYYVSKMSDSQDSKLGPRDIDSDVYVTVVLS